MKNKNQSVPTSAQLNTALHIMAEEFLYAKDSTEEIKLISKTIFAARDRLEQLEAEMKVLQDESEWRRVRMIKWRDKAEQLEARIKELENEK